MMGQPYQRGRLSVLPKWGWPSMTLGDDVATFVRTLVRANYRSPLNIGDGSSRPSKKGQPNGAGHSNKEH